MSFLMHSIWFDLFFGRLGMICVAKSVFQTDGLRGLYRGLSGMWAKEIPGSFVYFGSYELAKSIATANMDGSQYFLLIIS